ncbi:hypothetical protein CONPUDRAFT_130448 [Coniophora puteana RWD-64-598 SS2]|uniref:WW domain-containing protein n=1 Tax=Coniophora puteana (strain RWD-64-598) TaxID=741705 RepID=A0A5M3MAG4_CONPW|nr:uncharacterized protein CONPUDRAFT_130448 [Coniophora puteana RWD-64-598 SS2]EIW76097.1 hypothetical protein CONPUDRAFT_130448 [Coniophora puteana RWD-64-598 SS2]
MSSAIPPPPLPPGWTEHTGPGGQPYYYNAATGQSTYARPLPAFPFPVAAAKPKKQKLEKTPIPGTEWLRVKTADGNTFYTHKGRKESVWVVPDEIKGALEVLENGERAQREHAGSRMMQDEGEEHRREIERVKSEVQDAVKRKAEDAVPVEVEVVSKRARVEEEKDDEDDEDDEDDDDDDDSEESEEEEWQKEAAAQLAAEAEEERQRREEEARLEREAEDAAKQAEERARLNMPNRVDLSLDEAKALFKTLLREKDVNPLHPWDTSLPLFISDPRYVLLPSVSTRCEAFDDYCRERARELRQQNVQKEKKEANPKEEFDKLLSDEVKSTRASWTDFRRTWKKDRRFYSWGRDDREREKRFREYIKELGQKKRAAAEKAEADFFAMLHASGPIPNDANWKDIKKKFYSDARYDAVGSSSLREELFATFQKGQASGQRSSHDENTDAQQKSNEDSVDAEQRRKEKKERAIREREEKVRAERGRLEFDIDKSKQHLNKEEGEMEFRTLLVDAIRDPQISWDEAVTQLKIDPRFTNCTLPLNQQLHLFHVHTRQLQGRQLAGLHSLFEANAPSLATPFTALPVESLLKSMPVTKLGYDIDRLEDEYDRWQRERTHSARKAFDGMLNENSFVEFWGRLNKIGGEGAEGGVKADDVGDEDEGEGFGGKVDMKVLAKNVDISDMVKVLKNDHRYAMFDHVPEQRERWLRDHIALLSAPKLSVHV